MGGGVLSAIAAPGPGVQLEFAGRDTCEFAPRIVVISRRSVVLSDETFCILALTSDNSDSFS